MVSQSSLLVIVGVGVVALVACVIGGFFFLQRRRALRAYAHMTTDGTQPLVGGGGGGKKARSLMDASRDTNYVPPDFAPRLAAEPARVTLDDFGILRVLGRGAFGTVYQVKSKHSETVYAMKEISKSAIIKKGELEHTLAEREILLRAQNPFVVELYYTFQTEKKLYFVMEFVPGGELYTQLQRARRFPMTRARLYTAEITAALEYLHSVGVIYRDLKPENVLIHHDGHIKLLDFGLSKLQEAPMDVTATLCGTPEYLAPEVLRGEKYGKAVDWWSLGTMTFEMLFGLPPFYEAEDKVRMYRRILKGQLSIPPELEDADARNFLVRLLALNPNERLGGSARDAAEVKEHPFFSELNWDDVLAKRVKPVYVPRLKAKTDSSHFELDAEALAAPPTVPIDINMSLNEPGEHIDQSAFSGFSYTSRAIIGSAADDIHMDEAGAGAGAALDDDHSRSDDDEFDLRGKGPGQAAAAIIN
eukprot:Amastigsp_a174663_523.p1 type:complete len:474 gc:universal Amastigsp_a174663_523:137-1558(+)